MLSLIIALLTFFGAKRSGASTGAAALAGLGAGAASWFTIDPMNENRMFFNPDVSTTGKKDSVYNADGSMKEPPPSQDADSSVTDQVIGTLNGFGKGAKDVLIDWGPAGVVGGAVGIQSSGSIASAIKKVPPWMWWIAGGALLYKFVKD